MPIAYPACFFQEDAGYSVVFPDLGYLATCSDSLTGAFSAAVDCLAGYLHAAQRDGEQVPPPSHLRAMDPARIARELGAEPSESFVHMVTVDAEDYACIHFKKIHLENALYPCMAKCRSGQKGHKLLSARYRYGIPAD